MLPRTTRAMEEIKTTASPGSAAYTFPAVIVSALIISWAAEAAQFVMAQGAALALLAWLQTLPEYAVEFVIARGAARDPARSHLMIANLTGSLRLLTGLGWPMIYFTAMIFSRRSKRPFHGVRLEPEHSLEVLCLIPAILYWFVIFFKDSLTIVDGIILFAIYGFYIWSLRRVPPQEAEKVQDADPIARFLVRRTPRLRGALILFFFFAGGAILYLVATPFLESMLALSVSLGISQFVFVQWLAPFLSEFPEKVSAFNWARKIRTAPMAVMNMVSSNFNQWTVLAGTLPIVYSIYSGHVRAVQFDDFQRWEILLTLSQSVVGMVLLLNMHFSTWEAAGIFVLWLVQFVWPHSRHIITAVNFTWAAAMLVWMPLRGGGFPALRIAWRFLRGHPGGFSSEGAHHAGSPHHDAHGSGGHHPKARPRGRGHERGTRES
jgi:cation:H+ antiporter